MTVKSLLRPSEYHDSVSLMLVARELARLPGVQDAAVVMATEANKAILREAGLLTPEADAATPNDLLVAVRSADDVVDSALDQALGLLRKKRSAEAAAEFRPKTIRGAAKSHPDANVAVISVAGRYAAAEAGDALRRGLHVLLFSDNVSLEDEIALKRYARDHGLLMMGPGAGTTYLNGAALGFANVVPAGPVGIVSAAGTGLQEVSTLLARQGIGISQGLGTGGRDLQDAVGGIMTLEALQALQRDPATAVIVVVGKPPAPSVVERVLAQAAIGDKPTIVCFMGADPRLIAGTPNVVAAQTLEDAALLAARAVRVQAGESAEPEARRAAPPLPSAKRLRAKLGPRQKYLRGLFSGGTLCYEAQVIWRGRLRGRVLSNAPLDEKYRLPDSTRSRGHTAVDLGDEEFTVGRPHPMIDNDLRIRRLMQEARDPQVAAIYLDVVLGYGAHPDPAAELGPAIRDARALAKGADRELIVVASITGTEQDPQGLTRQAESLRAAGAIVCGSNAEGARLVGRIVGT